MPGPKKPTTDFSADDASYQAQIAKAKSGNVPVGNVPMPPMPRLDSPNPDRYAGVTDRSRAAMDRLLTQEERDRLMKEGTFRDGAGSAFASNQPGLRASAPPPGAVEVQAPTPGEFVNPPRPAGAGLRKETVEALNARAASNAKVSTKEDDEELAKTVAEVEDLSDGWITDEFGNRVRNLINNKERRAAIEARLSPMKVEDLFLHNEVRQKVPIIPNQFEPVFRSVSGNEDLFIKRKISRISGSDQFISDTFALMHLVAGLYGINGSPFPDHRDASGEPQDALFDAKYARIAKMPLSILTDLSTNFVWFNRRVNKLLVIDDIKGF